MHNHFVKKIILALLGLGLVLSLLAYPGSNVVSAQGAVFYVSPDGSESNDGSEAQPWDLQTALDQPDSVTPGSTIFVRGGTYEGKFTSHLNGAEDAYITVRAVPGERAVLVNDDSPALDLESNSYVTFWGLEISGPDKKRDEDRSESTYGIRVNQGEESHHVELVNMIIHDVQSQGIGWWQALKDSKIYGSLFYYNGTNHFDHGIYTHNVSGNKYFLDNMVFDNASHGLHAYAETEEKGLNNIIVDGNTFFNNGSIGYTETKDEYGIFKRNILMGGLITTNGAVITNNLTYYPGDEGTSLNLGYKGGSDSATVSNNFLMGGSLAIEGGADNLVMENNTVFAPGGLDGVKESSYAANNWLSAPPTDVQAIFRTNLYEPNRAHMTIYNYGNQETVTVPASTLGSFLQPGQAYELRNVQDYFGDVVTGTYDGSAIQVPMTNHTVAQPLGLDFAPDSTFPEFGAFVVIAK